MSRKLVAASCAALLLLGTPVTVMAASAATSPRLADEQRQSGDPRHPGNPHHPGRGALVSAERLYTLDGRTESAAELKKAGFDPAVARHGVDAYRLVYRTVDTAGRPTTASGLLALPRTPRGHGPLHAVSFTHGTGVHPSDAPSMQRAEFVSAAPVSYASAGFAAVAPDYLGMGTGPGVHPWMDVPSETSASLDMLRAARAFTPRTGHTLERDVMVTGFSQGASAALGLARALQAGEDRWFRAGALAPVSGAYDFGGTQLPATLDPERVAPKYAVVYAAYILVSVQRLHGGVYDDPGALFHAKYAGIVEELFDGSHTGPEMMDALPDTPGQLLTARGLDLIEHPTGRFADVLREAGTVCTDWAPRMPTRLYRATGDEQAVVENTDWCGAGLRANGADAPVVDLGPVDHDGSRHLGSSRAATAATVDWFRELAGAGR
ncbi:Secretory lipase [Streptomyces sp. YIM 130001]|uniref:alpha/beta hydrolase family protein n=1 Tax=Streptomyces sp. YIM 130001 TaxID=2259644 RepID=UPI000E657632|nr:lipase family protein [Streptomyces sp. YIM 130001]RII15327.1 Secretory lipase [Streptomyces sp. YIM 130001]